MKQLLLSTIFCLMISPLAASADIFQSFRESNFDQALQEAQDLSDANIVDQDGWTPLMYAARLGKVEIAKELLKKNADLEAQNHAGLTPYLWAAYAGHVDMMKLLSESGANIYHENAYHETVLDIATISQEIEAIKYILATTQDEDKKQEMAQNAIYLTQNDEIKALLIEAGAVDENQEEDEEETPAPKKPTEEELNAFIEQQHPEFSVVLAFSKNNEEKALSIIENANHIDPEFRTHNGWNLLALATLRNNPQIIRALINKGFDVNDNTAEFKATALILAITHNKKEAALELLKTPNILVDYQDETGRNALQMIQEENDADLIQAIQSITNLKEPSAPLEETEEETSTSIEEIAEPFNENNESAPLATQEEDSSASEHFTQETPLVEMENSTDLAAQEDSINALKKEPSNETEEISIVEKERKSAYSYH